MIKIGVFILWIAFFTSCKSADKVVAVKPASASCFRYGSSAYFNEQRIEILQQIVRDQIAKFKSEPAHSNSTQMIAKLEIIRRRISPPILDFKLNPKLVTKILHREAKNFTDVFSSDFKMNNSDFQKMNDYLSKEFLPTLEDRDLWGCEQKVQLTAPEDQFIPNIPDELPAQPAEPAKQSP